MRWLPFTWRLWLSNACYRKHKAATNHFDAEVWYARSLWFRLHFRPFVYGR